MEPNYKDGKLNGLGKTGWYENGQKKCGRITWKDGKPDGLGSYWHENGQKKAVVITWKDWQAGRAW